MSLLYHTPVDTPARWRRGTGPRRVCYRGTMGARRVLSWAVYGLPWLALQTFYRSFYRLVRRRRHRHFVFRGQELEYFYHRYNFTWRNERIVEVPIAWSFVEAAGDRRGVEGGNVRSHYFPPRHHPPGKDEAAPRAL